MEYKELLKRMDIDEVKSFKKALEENPNLLDKYISELEEKELEKKKEEERSKQAKEERINKLIKELLFEKENAEKLGGMSNLLNDAIKYFNNKSSIADDESVDIIERVHAKLSAIAVEITLINTFKMMSYDTNSRNDSECKYEIFAKLKNTKEKEFNKLVYYTSYKLECQYEILSYEYGKLLGLPDEEIINKTLPQFYDIRYATNLICTTGKTIEQQFDSFYDENENRYPLFCKREEDGSLSYPQENYTIWRHRNFDLDDVPSEYKDWREEYYSYNDEIANTLVEFFKYYFENPNKEEDEDYLRNNEIVGPDDYMPHGEKVKLRARTLSEKQSLDNLLSALYKNKSK